MHKNHTKIWSIVPAAGIGSRMKSARPKQYLSLYGKPILVHTLEKLCQSKEIDGLVVGIRSDDTFWGEISFHHSKFLGITEGGTERADTVLNSIRFLLKSGIAQEEDWALVHDAVRPCVSQSDIANLIGCAKSNGVGALLGLRMIDTLKKVDGNDLAVDTVERECYWRALTPQMFPIGTLLKALEFCINSGIPVTDESAAMEHRGGKPQLIESESGNIKITLKSDLKLAEVFMANKND